VRLEEQGGQSLRRAARSPRGVRAAMDSSHPDLVHTEASQAWTASLDHEARALFERAREQLEAGSLAEAVETLRRARERAPGDARIQSSLGVALAQSGGDFHEARLLCEEASRRAFDDAELYADLARVYLAVGRRSEALRYLRRGKMIDPHHADISQMLQELGCRRAPVLRSLPRRHWVNRVLGWVRVQIVGLWMSAIAISIDKRREIGS
jgi:Flp pilus assembly protein TadD